MRKLSKNFTLDKSVFEDLKHFAGLDDRKNSPFLNKLLKETFAEMKLDEGFQADNHAQKVREDGA